MEVYEELRGIHPAPPGDTTESFYALTPDRVLDAVEAAGLRCNPVCYPLNSFENRVYEVELEDRSRVVAKFYRPGRWSEEQILEEHAFVAELAAEELPVCTVRPFPDGATLKRIDHIHYSLSDRRGGRAPDELSDDAVERLGMFVARMHNVGVRRPAPARPRLDPDFYLRRTVRFLEERAAVPESCRNRYLGAARHLADVAERMLEGVEVHRVHADLHLGNVLFRDGELRVLDFDDFVTGPAVQDLWLALPGRDPETTRQRELFIEAYERFRLFDRTTLRLIEPLRGMRMVRYAGWLARRWDDPAFRSGWPHFGTEEYWLSETADLEDQLEATRRAEAAPITPGLTAATAVATVEPEVEEPLSNKDYFWDWEGD